MKIVDCKQNTPEWAAARLGLVTASEADSLITPLWKIKAGEGPTNYLYRKVCEKMLGFAPDTGSTWQMDHGSIMEHEAIPWFEFTQDTKVDRVGFCTTDDGRAGCSPDGLIGEDGGIECKVPSPPVHLRYLLEGDLPAEYRVQVNFSMYVTGRKWWKFLAYNRQFPPLLVTIPRDEVVMEAIGQAVKLFNMRFADALVQIKTMKDADNAAKTAAYVPDQTR